PSSLNWRVTVRRLPNTARYSPPLTSPARWTRKASEVGPPPVCETAKVAAQEPAWIPAGTYTAATLGSDVDVVSGFRIAGAMSSSAGPIPSRAPSPSTSTESTMAKLAPRVSAASTYRYERPASTLASRKMFGNPDSVRLSSAYARQPTPIDWPVMSCAGSPLQSLSA